MYYVLLQESKQITIRELFYRCKRLFKNQNSLIRIVDKIKARLNIELDLVPGYKGLLHGNCAIRREQKEIVLKNTSIIPYIKPCDKLVTQAQIVLVIEKEAVFNDIVQDVQKVEEILGEPIILVTGKGYPCTNTLLFLGLAKTLSIFGLFDCDPHGLCIYAVYKYGSKKRSHLNVPNMHRIGINFYDIDPKTELAEIKDEKEITLIKNLAELHAELENDINTMLKTKRKASIEDITAISAISEYIAREIRTYQNA